MRKATKIAMGLPTYSSTKRLMDMGILTTTDELIEANFSSQRANNIVDTRKKKAHLLTLCGEETYDTICSVVQPSTLAAVDYDHVVAALQKHYDPRPSEVAYYTAIRAEGAGKQQRDIRKPTAPAYLTNHHLQPLQASGKKPPKAQRCWRCDEQHSQQSYKLQGAMCHFCKKQGHIEKACITKRNQSKAPPERHKRVNASEAIAQADPHGSLPASPALYDLNTILNRRTQPMIMIDVTVHHQLIHFGWIPEQHDASTRFIKARPGPFAMQSAYDEELRKFEQQEVIEPTQHSDCATPLVGIVWDKGTAFVSAEIRQFYKDNCITAVTSAPCQPVTNGQAEHYVAELKRALCKDETGSLQRRLARFLFKLHTTVQNTTVQTPARLMFSREMRTPLTAVGPEPPSKAAQDAYDPRRSRWVQKGERVQGRQFHHKPEWIPVTVKKRIGRRSLLVEVSGTTTRRHLNQLRS
ncbi:uncharacterized protein LOC144149749 [Haemaphysalis longicornis]